MDTVHVLTLRTRDGRERTELVWLPTPEVREDFYGKARRFGIDIVERLNTTDDGSQVQREPACEHADGTGCH